MTTTKQLALQSKAASKSLSSFTAAERNDALQAIANVLLDHKVDILAANQEDVELAKKNDVSREMLDRLTLTEERLQSISQGLVHVKTLRDPLSQSPSRYVRDDGLIIENHRVPFGVIAMVYEARPNVTVDAAGLCLKSGNSVLLRGSSSAQKTNRILVTCMQEGLKNAGLPADAITLVPPHTRENVKELGQLRGIVDVMILEEVRHSSKRLYKTQPSLYWKLEKEIVTFSLINLHVKTWPFPSQSTRKLTAHQCAMPSKRSSLTRTGFLATEKNYCKHCLPKGLRSMETKTCND